MDNCLSPSTSSKRNVDKSYKEALNKVKEGCTSYLHEHDATKPRYPDYLLGCRKSSLVALFQRLAERGKGFFHFIGKWELQGECQGRTCIMQRSCFPGHGKCKCWLLLVQPFHNERKSPKSEAALQKSLWCTWRTPLKISQTMY